MAIDYVYSHHARLHHFNHIAKLIQLNVSNKPDTRNPARTLSMKWRRVVLSHRDGIGRPQHQTKDENMKTPLTVVQTDNGSDSMKAMVDRIARALVDQPEAVSVSAISSTHSFIVELKVAKDDLGKVIGKQGRTAGAMRTIVSAVSAKNRKHTVLEIIE
jgi:uncharacterized protein